MDDDWMEERVGGWVGGRTAIRMRSAGTTSWFCTFKKSPTWMSTQVFFSNSLRGWVGGWVGD